MGGHSSPNTSHLPAHAPQPQSPMRDEHEQRPFTTPSQIEPAPRRAPKVLKYAAPLADQDLLLLTRRHPTLHRPGHIESAKFGDPLAPTSAPVVGCAASIGALDTGGTGPAAVPEVGQQNPWKTDASQVDAHQAPWCQAPRIPPASCTARPPTMVKIGVRSARSSGSAVSGSVG